MFVAKEKMEPEMTVHQTASNQGLILPISHVHLGGVTRPDLTSEIYTAVIHAMSRPT